MSVLIRGMEMPTEDEEIIIRIDSSGTVMTEYALPISWAKAVTVPPHGRLIDKDALEADISASVVFSGRDGNAEIVGAKKIINRLHLAPTIIEAEEASDERS